MPPSAEGASCTLTSASMVPGAPVPEARIVSELGATLSDSDTSPAYVPLMAATPAVTDMA